MGQVSERFNRTHLTPKKLKVIAETEIEAIFIVGTGLQLPIRFQHNLPYRPPIHTEVGLANLGFGRGAAVIPYCMTTEYTQ